MTERRTIALGGRAAGDSEAAAEASRRATSCKAEATSTETCERAELRNIADASAMDPGRRRPPATSLQVRHRDCRRDRATARRRRRPSPFFAAKTDGAGPDADAARTAALHDVELDEIGVRTRPNDVDVVEPGQHLRSRSSPTRTSVAGGPAGKARRASTFARNRGESHPLKSARRFPKTGAPDSLVSAFAIIRVMSSFCAPTAALVFGVKPRQCQAL